MRDVIPEPIFKEIQDHIIRRTKRAEEGWEEASEDEDTVTGDLCGNLRRDWTSAIPVNGGLWSWRIRYKKFRGRGNRAFEKFSGADGIFHVEVNTGDVIVSKGILFQAKKGRGQGAHGQVQNMEELAPNGSAVFVFGGPDGYHAIPGHLFLKEPGISDARVQTNDFAPLGSFLAESFLPCREGLRGMYYDAVRKILIVPQAEGTIRTRQIALANRITLEVRRGAVEVI
jgi:hypothetical protein